MVARFSKLLGSAFLLGGVLTPPQSAFAQSAPADNMVATRYDVARRVTGSIAPDPDGTGPIKFAATRNTYNSRGLLIKVETGELAAWQSEAVAPSGWSGFTIFQTVDTAYDVMGRKIKDTVTAGGSIQSVTQYSYTAAGDLECAAVRMNAATFASPPASACTLGTQGTQGKDRITKNVYIVPTLLQKVQRAYGTPLQQDYVTFTYTSNRKQKTVTDANGTTATYDYDGHDRLKRWRFASKTTAGVSADTDYEEYGYDVAGRRTSLRKRDGSILTFNYDVLNRITSKIVPARTGLAATHTRDVYYGYDLRGLQLFARFDSASSEGLSFTYDNHGRMTGTTQAMNGTTRALTYQWDANSLRTRVTHADGAYIQYGYDGLDRPLTISSSATQLLSQGYNAKGEVTGRSLIGGVSTALTYDALSRPLSMTHDLAGTNGDIAYGYGYNRAGQITSRSRSNDAYIYGNDEVVARSYTVNGLNQYLATSNGNKFCYDNNGNLIADGTNVYLYDIENRLVESRAQQSSACPTATSGYGGALKATLRYDPLGRLYETGGGSVGITRFLYDGDELVAEYNSAGTTLRRYAHGVGADDPVVWYEGATMSSGRRMLLADNQGSIVSMANESGVLAGINSYDEWGVPDAGNDGRFQYTGQAWLPDLGMYHYKARIYSPTLGRFLQVDPLGYRDQVNLHAYVGNDPVNLVDPSGMAISACRGRSESSICSLASSTMRTREYLASLSLSPRTSSQANAGSGASSTSRSLSGEIADTIRCALSDACISSTPRPLTSMDLGPVYNGAIIYSGQIMRGDDTIFIHINDLISVSADPSGNLVVLQGLTGIINAASSLGINKVQITAILANPRLARFLDSATLQARYGATVHQAGPTTFVNIDVNKAIR